MQFRDLSLQYKALKNEIDAGIEAVIGSSAFILGKPVAELEEKLAHYVGRQFCVSCGNGTDALQLALMAMDVGPGDAVFVPDYTYFATAGAAAILGAIPVFTDIEPDTFNMSPDSLELQIQKVIAEGKYNPKVIIPVDLFGQPADYDRILPIAERYGLKVLEDGAQGFGGDIRGRKACSFGDISITSFFPAKPLGCYGDGGAVFTDDPQIEKRLRSLRALGKSPEDKYDNREIGINSRLDTLQAAVLLPKLKAFENYELKDVQKVAEWYSKRLQKKFRIPKILAGFGSSWAQYTVLCESEAKRTVIREELKKNDIPTMIYYPRCLHQQQAFADRTFADSDYQNSIEATGRSLSLPIHPYLTEDDVDWICRIMLSV